jgi:hypothetical protein
MNIIHVKRQVVVVGLTILTMAIGILSITGSDINQAAYAAPSDYQNGYNNACNGTVVDELTINRMKNPSDYRAGFDAGVAACPGAQATFPHQVTHHLVRFLVNDLLSLH